MAAQVLVVGSYVQDQAWFVERFPRPGETLRANHLKLLSDSLILRSQAMLYRANGAQVDPVLRKLGL